MFLPTQFPCDAWIVTRALRLKKVLVVKNLPHYSSAQTDAGGSHFWEELHETRNDALGAAMAKLAASKNRHFAAGKRIEQHEKNVNAAFLAAQEGVPPTSSTKARTDEEIAGVLDTLFAALHTLVDLADSLRHEGHTPEDLLPLFAALNAAGDEVRKALPKVAGGAA